MISNRIIVKYHEDLTVILEQSKDIMKEVHKQGKKQIKVIKLDAYKEIIETKLDLGVTVTGIYYFIKEKRV